MLYSYETWYLTVKEGAQLEHLKTRFWDKFSGPKKDENGQWKRLHNEELHSLYRSPNTVRMIKSRRLKWDGHVAKMKVEMLSKC